MLVLSRKKNEKVMIGEFTVVVVEIRGDKVRLGIDAPKEVPVHRHEVYEAIRRNQREVRSEELGVRSAEGTAAAEKSLVTDRLWKIVGKPTARKMVFRGRRNFSALHQAQDWLAAKGFCYGPTELAAPIAVGPCPDAVPPWREIAPKDRGQLCGLILVEEGPTLASATAVAVLLADEGEIRNAKLEIPNKEGNPK